MDRRLRELERDADPGGGARLLRERLRAGVLGPERLRLAAALGHRAAREALGEPPPDGSLAGILGLAAGLGAAGPVWVAAAAAREALARHELWLEEALPRVRAALEAVEAWADCPCERHREEATRRQSELGPLPRARRYLARPRVQVEMAARRALLAAGQVEPGPRAAAALAAVEAAEQALAGAGEPAGLRRASGDAARAIPLLEVRPRLQAWALGEPAPPPPPGVLDLVEAELQVAPAAAPLLPLLRAVRRGERDPYHLSELVLLGHPAPPGLRAALGSTALQPGEDWLAGLRARGPRGRAALAAALALAPGPPGRAALIVALRTLLEGRPVGRELVGAHDRAIRWGGPDAVAGWAARLCWDGGAGAQRGLRVALAEAGTTEDAARAQALAAFVSWRLEERDPLPRALERLEG